MARATRAAAAANEPVKVDKVDDETPKISRNAKRVQRRRLYKKAKRTRQIEAIKTALRGAHDPNAKKELSRLRGRIFRPRNKDSAELQHLKALLQKQLDEIETLRKALQATDAPRLESPATPTVEGAKEEPEEESVEIPEELLMEVAQSSYDEDAGADAPSATVEVEVEQVVQETTRSDEAGQMEGVETTTVATATTTENHIESPALPSVEGEEAGSQVQETIEGSGSPEEHQGDEVAPSSQAKGAGQVTPAKLSGTPLKPAEEFRGSSADSNAGTPRNVRRSPRKRVPAKRRSFAGHSYAG